MVRRMLGGHTSEKRADATVGGYRRLAIAHLLAALSVGSSRRRCGLARRTRLLVSTVAGPAEGALQAAHDCSGGRRRWRLSLFVCPAELPVGSL